MAAIASIAVSKTAPFTATGTTLGSDDTITFSPSKRQLLVLTNPTGSTVTATIDGDGGTTVNAPGIGPVTVSGGLAIPVAAGVSKAVVLSAISAYCKGVVHITGGTGIVAQLFDF
jgi:hypothetical protein